MSKELKRSLKKLLRDKNDVELRNHIVNILREPSERDRKYILDEIKNIFLEDLGNSVENIQFIFRLLLRADFDVSPLLDENFPAYTDYYDPERRKMRLSSQEKRLWIETVIPMFREVKQDWINQYMSPVEHEMKSRDNYEPHILNIVKGYVGFRRSKRRSRKGSRRASPRRSRRASPRRSRRASPRRSRRASPRRSRRASRRPKKSR
jgi:hypothetical protein